MAHNEATLRNGETLKAGEFLRSNNGLFHALMQEDGNFVVYRGDLFKTKGPGYEKTALWSTGSEPGNRVPYRIFMQPDGNLCIYGGDGGATWVLKEAYETRGQSGHESRALVLEDSGRLDLHGIWNSDKGDGYGEIQFESVKYILDPAPKINTSPFFSASVIGRNQLDNEQMVSFSVSYTDKTSSTFTSTTSLKVGTGTTIEAGIPGVAEGKVKVSTEVSTSIAWGKTTEHSETKTLTIPLKVEPHKAAQAVCVWKESTLDIPFNAVGKVKFDGYPDMLPVHVEGVYKGIVTHDVETAFRYVNDESGIEKGAMVGSQAGDGAVMKVPHDGNRDGWHPVPEASLKK